jgi:hypothetical protein
MRREPVAGSLQITRLNAALGLLRDLHRIFEASNTPALERSLIKLAFDVKTTIKRLSNDPVRPL